MVGEGRHGRGDTGETYVVWWYEETGLGSATVELITCAGDQKISPHESKMTHTMALEIEGVIASASGERAITRSPGRMTFPRGSVPPLWKSATSGGPTMQMAGLMALMM